MYAESFMIFLNSCYLSYIIARNKNVAAIADEKTSKKVDST